MTLYGSQNRAIARFFAVMTAIMMIISLIPLQAFAQNTGDEPEVITPTEPTEPAVDTPDSDNDEDSPAPEAARFSFVENDDNDNDDNDDTDGKVRICHATPNGYANDDQSVSKDSIIKENGHDSHNDGGFNDAGDIIPPFDDYAGKNWIEPYISIYNDGCQLPDTDEGEPEVATIVATKLVCTDEADLPNWGEGGADITSTTAADWIADGRHDSCSLQPDWQFEWTSQNTPDPRHSVTTGSAGASWHAFDTTTDANGVAKVELDSDEINGDSYVWVRENLQEGYIPFTWSDNDDDSNDVSAEMYCSEDVLHYDNWERVDNIQTGKTYNCVAWNVPAEKPEVPACEMGKNLLANGSFETPVQSNVAGWDIVPNGTSGLNWIVSWVTGILGAPETPNAEYHFGVNGWLASQGTQYTELDSDWGGPSSGQTGEAASVKLAQDVVTEPGATYELRYDFSPRPGTPLADNALKVAIEGANVATNTADGSANSQTSWTTYTKTFVAADASTNVAFEDAGTPNSVGTLLDNAVLCKTKDAPETPETGTIEITKYSCPADTVIKRSINGVGMQVPATCALQTGATFGYVHGTQTDANEPYPELSAPITAGGATNGVGDLTITNLPADGRYLVVETNGSNEQLPAGDILGLFCEGDGDESDNNDNQELTFVTEGQTTHCVAYNKGVEAPMCTVSIVSDETDHVTSTNAAAKLVTFFHTSWNAVVGGGSKWIWAMDPITDPVNETNETFTKSFNWAGATADITSAKLTIAADNSYVVNINASTSPALQDPLEDNYNLADGPIDVKSFIQTGVNNLQFDVKNWAQENGTYQTNPGGLKYQLEITGKNANCPTPDDGGGDNDPDTHTLHIDLTGLGEGIVTSNPAGISCDSNATETDCTAEFASSTVVTLTVTPDAGSNFDNSWHNTTAGTCTGNNTPCSFTMPNTDLTLTANFDLNGDDNDGGNGGGSSRHHSSGGSSKKGSVAGDSTDGPVGQVLGEATDAMPVGAPNTGAGGTSPVVVVLPSINAILGGSMRMKIAKAN